MKAITFHGCLAGAVAANRARHAATCARVVAAVAARDSRSEVEKAHRRFLAQLEASARRLEARR